MRALLRLRRQQGDIAERRIEAQEGMRACRRSIGLDDPAAVGALLQRQDDFARQLDPCRASLVSEIEQPRRAGGPRIERRPA